MRTISLPVIHKCIHLRHNSIVICGEYSGTCSLGYNRTAGQSCRSSYSRNKMPLLNFDNLKPAHMNPEFCSGGCILMMEPVLYEYNLTGEGERGTIYPVTFVCYQYSMGSYIFMGSGLLSGDHSGS